MAGREPSAGSFMATGMPGVGIKPRLMALTSGDNLHIIGVRWAACDLLRADGGEHEVGRFDRTAALDTVLRAYPVQKGWLLRPKIVSEFALKIEPTGV
jgi:hypothetical protein